MRMKQLPPPQPLPKAKTRREIICPVVLTIDQEVNSNIMTFLLAMERQVNALANARFQFDWHIHTGIKPVQLARNKAVEGFLAAPGDWLWFIDQDMIPPKNVLEMLEMPGDMRSGITYRVVDHTLSTCQYVWNKDEAFPKFGGVPWEPGDPPKIYRIDAAGTGCLMIHRKVLEDPRVQLKRKSDGKTYWFRESVQEDGESILSEDLDFTFRATRAGYDLLCNTNVPFGHTKKVDLLQCHRLFKQIRDIKAMQPDALDTENPFKSASV